MVKRDSLPALAGVESAFLTGSSSDWRPPSARPRTTSYVNDVAPLNALRDTLFTFDSTFLSPRNNNKPAPPLRTGIKPSHESSLLQVTPRDNTSAEEQLRLHEMEMSNPIIARYRRTTPRTREGDGRDKLLTTKLPAEPQPTAVRYSLRHGEIVSGSKPLMDAGDKFDEGHRVRSRSTYNGLKKLWRDGGEETPLHAKHFFKQLDKLKQNRFHDPRDVERQRSNVLVPVDYRVPTGKKKKPPSTIKVEQAAKVEQIRNNSVWQVRDKMSDSKSFYDTAKCYEKAFSRDWSRALRAHKLAAYIMKHDAEGDSDDEGEADGAADEHGNAIEVEGAAADSELVEVGKVMWKHHQLIYRCFDAYACADIKNNIDTITYNPFKDFVDDCDLDDPGSKHCDNADFDRLFIQINTKEQEGGGSRRGAAAAVELTAETVGKHGMAVTALKADEDKRALCRYEWFNVLVRIAIMKYVLPGAIPDASHAVDHLLTHAIAPKVDDWIKMDHQIFRRDVCYTEVVDAVLAEHKDSLKVIYSYSADSEGGMLGKEKQRKLMNVNEWLWLLKDLRLLDDSFAVRDATVIFVLSRMRVIDEKGKDADLKLLNLTTDDFYEALLRVSCLKALPTDEEIEEAGCTDAGDFMLRLADIEKLDDWCLAYYRKHGCEMGKPPPQPIHRCVAHLISLMVRTIEMYADESQAGMVKDQKLTMKEMKNWQTALSVEKGNI